MSIPDNRLSSKRVLSPFLYPRDLQVTPSLDYELGGVALNDPSQGLRVKAWQARLEAGGLIFVEPLGETSETPFLVRPKTQYVSLAFDSNMRPTIAYFDGQQKLYWYDSTIENFADTVFNGTSGRVTLDDKRPTQNATRDVIFCYLRDRDLYFRQQRDRYEIEYLLAEDIADGIVNFGMGTGNRLIWKFLQRA